MLDVVLMLLMSCVWPSTVISLTVQSPVRRIFLVNKVKDGPSSYLAHEETTLIVPSSRTNPIFAKFKGGKGVGPLIGVLLALFPIAFPLCLIVAIGIIIKTGYVSLGSIFAAISLPIFILILPTVGIVSPNLSLVVFSLLVPWFVIYTHRSNISRIRNGTENRFDKALIFKNKTTD